MSKSKRLSPSRTRDLLTTHRAFNLAEFHEGKAQQSLPETLMRHEHEIGHFESRCHGLCMRILRLFALGLKVRNFFYLRA